jgi:hypothetical protein
MDMTEVFWKRGLLRAAVVTIVAMAVGFAFFRSLIFIPTMKASQFMISGVTAGIAYAGWRGTSLRQGIVPLFLWYLVLMFLVEDFNSWLPVLDGAYIVGIAGAVWLYLYAVRASLVRGWMQRVAAAAVLVALANGLIVVVLAAVSVPSLLLQGQFLHDTVFWNMQIGTLIGLGVGWGFECAEYLTARFLPEGVEAAGSATSDDQDDE